MGYDDEPIHKHWRGGHLRCRNGHRNEQEPLMNVPKNYPLSKDLEIRPDPKTSAMERAKNFVRERTAAVKSDWDSMKQIEAAKKNQPQSQQSIPSYKKGGLVTRTGLARLHKNELVIPAKGVRKMAVHKTSNFHPVKHPGAATRKARAEGVSLSKWRSEERRVGK